MLLFLIKNVQIIMNVQNLFSLNMKLSPLQKSEKENRQSQHLFKKAFSIFFFQIQHNIPTEKSIYFGLGAEQGHVST